MPNKYYTSTGEAYTQSQINSKLSRERKGWMESYVCQCCQERQANDPDHTLSQKACKWLHKTELIWDENNISWSCRSCHLAWESPKSGEFIKHKNFEKRMDYLRQHDPEGYTKRMIIVEEFKQKENEQKNKY